MAAAYRSGQTTVTTAGTEVVLGNGRVNGAIAVRALSTNTGKMYIGNQSGTVASTTGYELSAGDQIILEEIGDLNELWVDSSVNGEKVCYLCLGRLE